MKPLLFGCALALGVTTVLAQPVYEFKRHLRGLAVSPANSGPTQSPTTPEPALAWSASTSALVFGSRHIGATASQSLWLTNTGEGALTLSAPNVTGAGFALTSTSCGTSLAVGQSCQADLSFTPSSAGSFEGQLTWGSTASTLNVLLSGTGTALVVQNFGSYRAWSDGTLATSCEGYRRPSGGRVYEGDIGDGTYRIHPPGYAAFNVHCNMTTDGGGWTLVAWTRGNPGLANMPIDFMVRQVNAAQIANTALTNASSSINTELFSRAVNTQDVMVVSPVYSPTPIIEHNQGNRDYDSPDCQGPIGHTGRNAGCGNHTGNDNFDNADRFNVALYPGNRAFVPGWINMGNELCWSGFGWCSFEFYLR